MSKLNVKSMVDFNRDVKHVDVDYEICKRPLFHGTRRYALEVSEENRQKFYNACNIIAPFAKELIRNKKIEHNYVVDAANRSSAYEYGDLYLTIGYTRAINYSYYAGGELGQNVYRVCEDIINKGIEIIDEIKEAIEIISSEYEKYQNSEKVVLVFFDVKFDDLYTRGGRKFIDFLDINEDVKEEIDELYAEEETLGSSPDKDFRLKNPNDYEIYIVNEKDFREGVKLFTKINDIDECIRRHNSYVKQKWDF